MFLTPSKIRLNNPSINNNVRNNLNQNKINNRTQKKNQKNINYQLKRIL